MFQNFTNSEKFLTRTAFELPLTCDITLFCISLATLFVKVTHIFD